ncbi:MAG: 30S ribosomal protein S18 [Elusimicrobia bacterium]|nr:30S ribosomal protein S18 [Elusimicrobiota bacterium]MBU2615023.1 30S ribosomal protein S18 [Elusimicrobiota bacterium]
MAFIKGKRDSKDFKGKRPRKMMISRRKVCRFCAEYIDIDYKDANLLRNFITERGKILAGRITGVCSKHQRILTDAIKRARVIAILPFANIY